MSADTMKLWLLQPKDLPPGNDPWHPWYDKAFGFVVRAETEREARDIAHDCAGDENRDPRAQPWKDAAYSTCVELTIDGEAGMVLRNFHSA